MTPGHQEKPRSAGLGGVLKSLRKSFTPALGSVPVTINAKVVGGGDDMQRLLLQLQHGSLQSRASALTHINKSLEKFSISSIPEVWYLARDLCSKDIQPAIRREALNLMVQCIRQRAESTGDSLLFYTDIVRFCLVTDSRVDPDFDLFLENLRVLTKDGREFHDYYVYDANDSFPRFVLSCFSVLAKHAKEFTHDDTIESVKDERNFRNLQDLTAYVTNCLKYNFSVVDDDFVSAILSTVVLLAMSTENIPILSSFLDVIQTVLAFGFIPLNVYDDVIRVVCVCDASYPELLLFCQEIHKQTGFERPYTLFVTLAAIIRNASDTPSSASKSQNSTYESTATAAALGALNIMERVTVNVASFRDLTELPTSVRYFIAELVSSRLYDNPVLNSALLGSLDRLFNSENYKDAYSVTVAFSAIFPFHLWYVPSASMFDLLDQLKVSNAVDMAKWGSMCRSLLHQTKTDQLVAPKESLIRILLKHPESLTPDCLDFILDHYQKDKLCCPPSTWHHHCKDLLASLYFTTPAVSSAVRITTLKTVKGSFLKSTALLDDHDAFSETIVNICESAKTEKDQAVLEYVMGDFLGDILPVCSLDIFVAIFEVLGTSLVAIEKPEKSKSIVSLGSFGSSSQFHRHPSSHRNASQLDHATESRDVFFLQYSKMLSKMMVITSTTDAAKAAECFRVMVETLHYFLDHDHIEPLIVLLRCLCCLRVDDQGLVYFTKVVDVGGLAGAFKRNKTDSTFDSSKEKLWVYPEEKDFIPGNFLDVVGTAKLFDPSSPPLALSESPSSSSSGTIDIRRYLDILTLIMEDFIHWEVYSFVWTHYCSQLTNMQLFDNQPDHIRRVQRIVCDQLTLNLPKSLAFPPANTSATKGDLQVALTRTLSALVGYHELFVKAEQDQIVSSLLFAMGSWEKTAIPCIHILNVCCYDMPSSVKKYLTAILTRLQTGITSTFASSPTLEFLMSLVYLPSLTLNFTLDDFKRVLAIAFKYIQFASDQKTRNQDSSATNDSHELFQQHGVEAEVEHKTSTQSARVTPLVNEYVSVLAYLTVSRWFLTINMSERRHLSSFIVRSLTLSHMLDQSKYMQERTIAFTDLIMRFAFSDMPLKVISGARPLDDPDKTSTSTWVMGYSIITVSTNITSGDSTIRLRRPSGTTVFSVQLDPQMFPLDFTNDGRNPSIVMSPYFLLQLLNHIDIQDSFKPVPLLDDAATERALASLDRIPPVLFHKAGILYIGPGQKEEAEILGNVVGSTDYHRFLDRVGRLIKLRDADSVYVGGLDKEGGSDGEYALYWSDKVSQMIFHTTTLMPNNGAHDRFYDLKKRHIGNNYVNVFFDESGLPFNFNVIKSQFNFMNIVISPHTVARRGFRDHATKVYKVKTFRRSGVPGVFSTTHFKMVSAEQLPHFVRNLVLICDRFANVWHNYSDGEYVMNWQLRVKQIVALRVKTEDAQKTAQNDQSLENDPPQQVSPDAVSADMTRSFMEQLQATRETNGQMDAEKYSTLEFNSYT